MEGEKKKRPIDSYFGVELDMTNLLKHLTGAPGYTIADCLDVFVSTDSAVQKVAIMETAPMLDMSNIKAEDRPYVHEVIQYLRQNGLRAELKGSAEFSKNYNDIDILTKGSLEDVTKTAGALNEIAFHAILGSHLTNNAFYRTAADGKEYSVMHEGMEVRYMNTRVAQLFRIIVGNTKIHVGLKTDPVFGGRSGAAA